MRILVVNNLYPPVIVGGYEVECRDVVEHLRERHDVTVLTSVRGAGQVPGETGVLRRLPFVRHLKRDALRAPLDALRAARVMRETLAEIRPDVVYVWNGAQVPYAALRVADYSGIPLAFRVCEHWFGGIYGDDHFLKYLRPGHGGLRGAWARVVRAANRHPELRFELERRAPAAVCWNAEALRGTTPVPPTLRPVHETVVHPSNARTDAFERIERRPAGDGPPRIVFVGRLDVHKGADVAIRALAALRGRHGVEASLLVAGEGPRRDELTALAAELGIAEHVEFPGPLRGDALFDAVGRAGAWVIPSVWPEPAGLVCTEAALARVPAVLSRVGGIGEMLHEEEHGLFFDRADHDGCADALARTFADPQATQARTARAFERGRELGWAPYLAAMDRFLDDAVAALRADAASPPAARP